MTTRLLVLASNPSGTEQLQLNPEIRSIRESYERSKNRDEFTIRLEPAIRISELQRIIIKEKPRIIHFCGHGTQHRGLVLENDAGQPQLVSTEALTNLLKIFARRIECVILNACHSHDQGQPINQQVNYLIATNKEIRDDAALLFTKGFYDALFNGETYKNAYELGCNRIHLELYKSNNSDRKLVPVYSEPQSQYLNLPQHEILLFLEKNPLNIIIKNDISISNYTYPENVEVESDSQHHLPCPYRGLFHFNPNDAELFFGREVVVQQLFQASQTHTFIPVLGASGSGKSSVVLAGLVPRLEQEGNWLFAHFCPGDEPFHSLAKALVPLYEPTQNPTEQLKQSRQLAEFFVEGSVFLKDVFTQIESNSPNQRVLLIADQFEELYTLCPEENIHQSFLDLLLDCFQSSSSNFQFPPVLVITMRADFLGHALSYRPLADVLNSDIKLGAMTREELSQVIEKPAAFLGVKFEPGLVERILDDVENEPGNLALLEFALTELWQEQTNNHLTHNAYEKIGQVKGALAKYAEQEYQKLAENEQKQAQQIFLHLIRLGEDNNDTRRRVNRHQLGEDHWHLVTRKHGLADSRLVVTNYNNTTKQETVEIVHEALIQHWDTLREWMKSDRDFRVWQERLRQAKEQWETTDKKDKDLLLRGAMLALAQEKLRERAKELISEDEQEFICESIKESERLKKRNSSINIVLVILSILSLGLSIVSSGLSSFANQKQQQAEIRELEVLLESAEKLLASNQKFDALIASIQAAEKLKKLDNIPPSVQGELTQKIRKNLLKLVDNVDQIDRLDGHENWVYGISFSPDGNTLASVSADNTLRLWEKEEAFWQNTQIEEEAHQEWIYDVAFSPDGKKIATASRDRTVKIWNWNGTELTEEALPPHQFIHEERVSSVSFIPNQDDEDLKLLDPQLNLLASEKEILATASWDGTVKLWNINTGTLLQTLESHTDQVFDVSFSPNGKLIATASADRTIKLWKMQARCEPIAPLSKHNNPAKSDYAPRINQANFHSQGNILATATTKPTIEFEQKQYNCFALEYSLNTNTPQENGHEDKISSVSFSPDGTILATASWDQTIKLWDTNHGTLSATLEGHQDRVFDVSFSFDGQLIATASWDRTVKIWNRQGILLRTLTGHQDRVFDVSFLPHQDDDDSKILATASADRSILLWKLKPFWLPILRTHDKDVRRVEFSPNGKIIATASQDGTAKFWQTNDGTILKTQDGEEILFQHEGAEVYGLSFHSEGIIATSGTDKKIKLWSLEQVNNSAWQFKQLQEFNPVDNQDLIFDISFSPDGKWMLSAGADYKARLWKLSLDADKIIPEYYCTMSNQNNHGHSDKVVDAEFLSFEHQIAQILTASDDGTAKLWQLGQTARTSDNDSDQSSALKCPLSKTLPESPQEGHKNGKGHKEEVNGVSFISYGQCELIATASDDQTIKLWNLEGHEIPLHQELEPEEIAEFKELEAHQERVMSVQFSPLPKLLNEKKPASETEYPKIYLASASFDKTVKLWQINCNPYQTMDEQTITMNLWRTFRGHDDWLWDVSFSPDGTTLASASKDKTVRLWFLKKNKTDDITEPNLKLKALVAQGCNLVRGYLNNPKHTTLESERDICKETELQEHKE